MRGEERGKAPLIGKANPLVKRWATKIGVDQQLFVNLPLDRLLVEVEADAEQPYLHALATLVTSNMLICKDSQ
mgnify:CR=1 FL=1